jgi:hypothetical protein
MTPPKTSLRQRVKNVERLVDAFGKTVHADGERLGVHGAMLSDYIVLRTVLLTKGIVTKEELDDAEESLREQNRARQDSEKSELQSQEAGDDGSDSGNERFEIPSDESEGSVDGSDSGSGGSGGRETAATDAQ